MKSYHLFRHALIQRQLTESLLPKQVAELLAEGARVNTEWTLEVRGMLVTEIENLYRMGDTWRSK